MRRTDADMNAHTSSKMSRRGWSDFVLTVAENLFPTMGLCRIARFIVNRHYAGPRFLPSAKSLALARIAEKERDYQAAEEHYNAAIRVDTAEPDPYLYLGQFYER